MKLRLATIATAALIFVTATIQFASSTHAAAPQPLTCARAVAAASRLNAFDLLRGSTACQQDERQEDTNFLLILGQIRAVSDLAIFMPVEERSTSKAGELYILLISKFGGNGFDEFYRTPSNMDGLEKRVRDTDMRLTQDYDPGWAYKPSSKTDIYAQMLADTRENNLWKMRYVALKIQNDEFYQAYREFIDLHKKNQVIREGTPVFEQHKRLLARMNHAESAIPRPPPPPKPTIPISRFNEQDPELAKRQVAMGFNGPESGGIFILRSEAEVRHSWLAPALPNAKLNALIAGTDFSQDALVGASFGKQSRASGEIIISELSYNERTKGYSFFIRLGIVPGDCGSSSAASYPFVIGKVRAVAGAMVLSSGSSNFPADCKPIVSSKPTARP
jgi:hypothetical protein